MKPLVPSIPLFGIFVITLISGCSSQDIASNDPLLIGGSPVIDESDFPATVGISMKGKLCTGSKIGPRQILTAGHCVEDKHGKKLVPDGDDFGIFTYNVQSVPPDRTHRERRIRTEKIVTHPRFRAPNPGPDDIAIIFTAEDISWIPQARLESNTTAVGTPVSVAGYGCEEGRNIPPTRSPRLKSASANTVSPNEALEDLKVQPWFNFPTRAWLRPMLKPEVMHILRGSAAGAASATCPGDSGGPLFLDKGNRKDPAIVGITSFSANGGGNLARWSFLVRIDRHASWLKQVMAE
jgi:secreted trypsin-like serine protease